MNALPIRAPLRASSALLVCTLDWVSYALSASHAPALFPAIALGSGLFAALCVVYLESHDPHLARPALRAALTGFAVAVPLPMLGTALAMLCMVLTRASRSARAAEKVTHGVSPRA
jgi:hypothetical protein